MNLPDVTVQESTVHGWTIRIADGETTLLIEPSTPEELTYVITKLRGNSYGKTSVISLE